MAAPVVTALAPVRAVKAIVYFGSYAVGLADAASDLDLYVICHPTVIPEATRHPLLTRLPGVTALHIHKTTPVWSNPWAPAGEEITRLAHRILAYPQHYLVVYGPPVPGSSSGIIRH